MQLRTSEVALRIVKRGRELALADTGEALKFIWDTFDQDYGEQYQLANVVLKKLQNYPEVSLKKPEDLKEFRNICTQAKILARTHHGRSLISLDCEDMQKTVSSRLDDTLKMQWAKNRVV